MPIPQPWSAAQRIAFRFFFVFFALYIFPFPINIVLPWPGIWYNQLWQVTVPWFGEHVLHLSYPITIFPNGSGDTTFNYVQLLMMVGIAVCIALIWTLFSKRRTYNALHHWLRVALRFYLAMMMFSYGFAKVFHLQMPFPSLSQLVQPFGDKSPMGLAWSYVGYSAGFSAFTGWAEVIAGALLVWRRTVALGALACIVVVGNIVAMNFFFDVPVKLFSSTLLLMSLFLLAPDLGRFLKVFVFNEPVAARSFPNYLPKRWMRITAIVLNVLFVAYLLTDNIMTSQWQQKRYSPEARAAQTPLYGIYNAAMITRNNDTVPMLLTDSTYWKQIIIQNAGYAQVKRMNDTILRLNFRVDTAARTATIFHPADTLNKTVLSYTADSTSLTLHGIYQQDSVRFQYKKQDVNAFRLVNRGFHWINEYPFNR